ncbi:MAG TPA: SMC family ATPase, partial [Nitriliruptorales bacterium]
MVFCLYGSVPRYDDKRLVAPVISQGQLEARIRLDFSVDGREYTAVRVIRRTRAGATTKEARLEHDGRTLAATADELTTAVEALLGLSFEHFTRTVVLPQGDFQEFLHARPKDRQDLLVQLLDLDVYRRVASAARSDEAQAKGAIEGMRSRLEVELAEATDEAVTQAEREAGTLGALVADLDAARPELEALVESGRAARRAADEAAAQRDAVAGIQAPEGLAALATRLQRAAAAVHEAEGAAATAELALEQARAARADRPATARIQQVLEARVALARAQETADQHAPAVAAADQAATAAEGARAEAQEAVERAEHALEERRRRHAAHALAVGLEVGDDCPVCDRELTQVPRTEAPADLDAATAALAEARTTLRQRETAARAAADAAAAARARAEAAAGAIQERAAALTVARAGAELPEGQAEDQAELQALLAELTEADTAVTGAEQAARDTYTALQQARAAATALDEQRTSAFRDLDHARDRVAGLEPPPVDREDLGAAWTDLLDWARRTLPGLQERAAQAEQAIGAAVEEYGKRISELRDRAGDGGVEVPPAPQGTDAFSHLRDACVAARTKAATRAEHLTSLRDQAAEVRRRLAATEQRARLSAALGQHLNARKFEKWLLNRALQRLVAGASQMLRELSSGAYSLALGDDNNFLVIDHRNADEQRSARTLSGGETFLASLALALSLAEDVAALAAHGSARLEALFLDEGFGTLDSDTLDTVAAAIEELGSRGRMVGLITHVRDLSERMPVRYEVRKGPGGSTVEKVTA